MPKNLLQLIEERGFYRGALDMIIVMETMHQPYPQTKHHFIEKLEKIKEAIIKLESKDGK